jgi:hypothetical protein
MSVNAPEPNAGQDKTAEPTGETIPDGDQGVGLGAGEEATTFEPEEDPEAQPEDI